MSSVRSLPSVVCERLGYMPALDGIRGIGLLAVIAHHTGDRRFGYAFSSIDSRWC